MCWPGRVSDRAAHLRSDRGLVARQLGECGEKWRKLPLFLCNDPGKAELLRLTLYAICATSVISALVIF